LKIGNVEIKGKVVCAPMAGITNIVYRKIAKDYGASLVYTEMISDKALCFNSEATYEMIKLDEKEHPVAIQLFGGEKGDPELPHIHSEILLHLTDGICSLFVEHFDLIDLNLYKMGQSQIDKKIARAP